MEFRIADTFTDSLGRLTGDEQKLTKTTAFDLQLNPASPGMSFHKLDRARDKRFWSVRVNRDLRLIVHKSDASLVVCYVDHHDKAYEWAERRKLETHPTTGAAQLVVIRETVQEIMVPVYVPTEISPVADVEQPLRPVLAHMADTDLLAYGIPAEWIADVKAASQDQLLALTDHLPAEAAEAVLELAVGGKPRVHAILPIGTSPFDHPDAQRRFRVMTNVGELRQALDFPWEKWTVFLHPDQRQLVDRTYNGPARVAGSAGTGKTIVALHRAAFLARKRPDARVLLTTFSDTLANALRTKLRRLLSGEPRLGERIDVYSLDAIGLRLYRAQIGPVALANREIIHELLLNAAASTTGHTFGPHFLRTEWEQVVDAWQLDSWAEYRDVARLGRKTRLSEAKREVVWSICDRVRQGLRKRSLITAAELFTTLAAHITTHPNTLFDYVAVDEAQDLGIAHLRFLAALGGGRPNALFFAGDLGQRIFQQPFSWRALGVDVRGRSRTLRVNYRTSHQIRMHADRLLGESLTDVDGEVEERSDTVSVFNGPTPDIRSLKSEEAETRAVGQWIADRASSGMQPHEIGIFVRSDAQVHRARAAVTASGLEFVVLDEHVETSNGRVSISTMHLAKGLEFRAVVVMACDDEVIPLQQRIETVGDEADLKDVYDTERQLLYVACTRARDQLLVTSVDPASEFVDDLRGA
jgi:hypothetical protein